MRKQKKKILYYGVLGMAALMILGAGKLAEYRIESRPVSQLLRPDSTEEFREEELLADDGEKKIPVTLQLQPRKRTAEELDRLFDEAKQELLQGLAGENEDISHVTMPLYMPVTAMEDQVSVSWSSDQPEYISYDGSLGEAVPEQGVTVELEAAMTTEQQVRCFTVNVTAFPREEEAGLERLLETTAEDGTSEYYTLPESYEQKTLTWYRKANNPAPLAAVAVVVTGCLLPLRRRELVKQERARRRESLLQAYSSLVSQLTLYLGAGISLSQAFSHMAACQKGQPPDILQKECALVVGEMARGIPEGEAILRFGDRSGLWEYRTFCGMLLQNRKKGNDELLPMLQKEADKAFAERQRRARITGNEAATKLLLPMALMLVIVLMIVLFPAMVSFYA